jgi:opacity protein-like surface antigen
MTTSKPKTLRNTARGRALCGLLTASMAILAPPGLRAGDSAVPRFSLEVDTASVSVRQAGFGRGWKLGAGVMFRTARRMGTEVMLETFGAPVAAGAEERLLARGRMTMTTLLFNERLYILTRGRVLPYGLLGIGFSFLGFEPESWPAGVKRRVFVDRMALQLGGGVDLWVLRRLALCGKLRYNMVKTWMENEGRTYPIRDDDPLVQNMLYLYGLELGIGVKVSF